MTSEEWVDGVKEGKIKDAKSFKPARGKLASGGQMDVVVEIGSKSYPAVFLAKRGPEEFDISQLAVYQVDRLLGVRGLFLIAVVVFHFCCSALYAKAEEDTRPMARNLIKESF